VFDRPGRTHLNERRERIRAADAGEVPDWALAILSEQRDQGERLSRIEGIGAALVVVLGAGVALVAAHIITISAAPSLAPLVFPIPSIVSALSW